MNGVLKKIVLAVACVTLASGLSLEAKSKHKAEKEKQKKEKAEKERNKELPPAEAPVAPEDPNALVVI